MQNRNNASITEWAAKRPEYWADTGYWAAKRPGYWADTGYWAAKRRGYSRILNTESSQYYVLGANCLG